MTRPTRSQDVWNAKNGFTSKSYKLNKSIVNSFAAACSIDSTSQAKQLTNLMSEYSIPIERRTRIMYVHEKYATQENYQSILQTKLEEGISSIQSEDIERAKKELMDELSQKRLFDKYTSSIEYTSEIDQHDELLNYLNSDANMIIKKVKNIYLNQVAIFQLMIEGYLMPLSLRQNDKIQFDVNHAQGNHIFDVYLDCLPYETFAIVRNCDVPLQD